MEKKFFLASCPVCGRSLFKGSSGSYVEGGCPKCKNYLQIHFKSDGVKSLVSEKQDVKSNN